MDTGTVCANDDFLFVEMEISRPICWLKELIFKMMGMQGNLESTPVFLRGTQLSENASLIDNCTVTTGMVVVKCKLKPDYAELGIEIDDVLLAADESEAVAGSHNPVIHECAETENTAYEISGYLWKRDPIFSEQQAKRHMSLDPSEWSVGDVRYWLGWARSVFRSTATTPNESLYSLNEITLTGVQLCSLTKQQLSELVIAKNSVDSTRLSDLVYIHLTLVKEHHHIYRPWPLSHEESVAIVPATANPSANTSVRGSRQFVIVDPKKCFRQLRPKPCLWRFILDCLITFDNEVSEIICWTRPEASEFTISKPEEFASMWCEASGRKDKEKGISNSSLSRALRMYSSEGIILKRANDGSLWKFQFVTDLSQLIGYSAVQLQALKSST